MRFHYKVIEYNAGDDIVHIADIFKVGNSQQLCCIDTQTGYMGAEMYGYTDSRKILKIHGRAILLIRQQ